MFNLNGAEEVVTGNFEYVTTGIHDFVVDAIVAQPVGPSVLGEEVKAGIKNYTLPQLLISLTCTTTHAGKDSTGRKIVIGILPPTSTDPDKKAKQESRLVHIFANMSSSAAKETTKKGVQSINVNTLDEFAAKLKGLVGRSVRYKLVADQNGKYPQLPNYYGGFAEPADVEFSKSTLKYDAAKEGTKEKPAAGSFEKPTETDDLFGNSSTDTELPF